MAETISEERRGAVNRNQCPTFTGKMEEYERWKIRIEDWLLVNEDQMKYPGLEVRLALRGRAYDAVEDIDREILKDRGGEKEVFRRLDKMYLKDSRMNKIEKAFEYFKIEKKAEETMKEFIVRYEKAGKACESVGGGKMSEELKGSHLLGGAGLNKMELHIVLGACGSEEYNFETVRNALGRIFQEDKNAIDKKQKECFGEEGKKMNPLNKYGKRAKCLKCRSEEHFDKDCPKSQTFCYICKSKEHWAKDCSRNWNNQEKNKEQKRNEEVYLLGESAEEKKETEMNHLEAILDTGCNRTVCGERNYDQILAELSLEEVKKIEDNIEKTEKIFVFGNTEYKAQKVAHIPCQIESNRFKLRTQLS